MQGPLATRFAVSLLFVTFFTASCSMYNVYRSHLWEGKNLLMEERYEEAREMFVKAAQEQNRAAPFAYAATAYYKLGDIKTAEGYIFDAENKPGKDYIWMRILAYKALVLFREDRRTEGMAALRDYLDYYRNVYPLVTYDDVESMWKSGRVDLPVLERLLDQQVATYDRDMYLAFSAAIGYYSRRYPQGKLSGFMPD